MRECYNKLMVTAVWNLKQNFVEHASQLKRDPRSIFDCMIAEYLLCEGKYFYTLETTMARYNAKSLQDVYEKQKELLEKNPKMNKLFWDIEMPLVRVLKEMEEHGICIDEKQLVTLGKLLDQEIQKVTAEVDAETMLPVNLSSPLQVGKMLVETFGVPLKKSMTGKYATGEPELMKHVEKFPIIQKLLKYRQVTKLKSTYVEGLIKNIEDGRIHTTYNQTIALTGRLSSSKPNLQNIPGNSEIGKQIKSCFVASEGHVMVALDYSQQELRILAHITKEPKLIEAFSSEKDIHTVTASTMFEVPYEQITREQRNMAKTINFGVLYGMGSFGLSQALGISAKEANKFINDFFENFSEVKKFYASYMAEAAQNGYADTLFGRRRFVKELDNATRRELANYPIQGAAADMMKKTMVDVDRDILAKYPQARMMLQIHDELVFEVPEGNDEALQVFIHDVKTCMESTYKLDVPIKVEVNTGKNWGELKG